MFGLSSKFDTNKSVSKGKDTSRNKFIYDMTERKQSVTFEDALIFIYRILFDLSS